MCLPTEPKMVMAHAWYGVLQLSAVFFTASIVSAQDCSTQQDTGPCLYFYENIHSAATCPKGVVASFVCRGQVPAESLMDIRWYWTQNENEAGTLGTLITDGSKYITWLHMDPPTNGRTIFFSTLSVHNFNDTDTGFYWCQMVVNESRPLEPSCPMEITAVPTNGSVTDVCMDTGGTLIHRQCADFIVITETSQFNPPTPSVPTAIMSESSLLPESLSTPPGSTLLSKEPTPTATPVPMHTGTASMATVHPIGPGASSTGCEVGGSSCSAVYGALGAAVVVIVLVGGVMVGLLGWVYLIRKKLPSKTSPSTQTDDEDYYSYPEPQTQGKDVLDRAGTGTYQTLELDSRDYTSVYCSLNLSTRQQTTPPTTERDGHVYAVADTHSTEPPHQYASLVLSQ